MPSMTGRLTGAEVILLTVAANHRHSNVRLEGLETSSDDFGFDRCAAMSQAGARSAATDLRANLHLRGFAAEYLPESFSRHKHIMGSLKKRRKAKINKHKRRKKLRAHRHKKRTWQK
jgi:hypothetical protein